MPPTLSATHSLARAQARRYIWPVWGLAVGSVFAIAAAFAMHAFGQSQRAVDDLGANLSQGIEQAVSAKIGRTLQAERALADFLGEQISRTGKPDLDATEHLIEKFHKRSEAEPGSLRVTDKAGILIAGAGARSEKKIDYSGREYFKELANNPAQGSALSGLVVGFVSKKPQLVLAAPYFDAEGVFSGVIHSTISLERIEKIMRTAVSNRDDTIVLHDVRDYSLLARYDPKPLPPESAAKAATLSGGVTKPSKMAIDSGKDFGHYIIPSNESADVSIHYATFNRVTDTPLFLIVSLGDSHMQAWRDLVRMLGLLSAGFAALSWFAARALTRSSRASESAERAREALNASLETQVRERTSDLSEALERLTRGQRELDSAERLASLGQMVAGVAHELNTPIGNALLCASSMSADAQSLQDALTASAPSTPPLKRSTLVAAVAKLHRQAEVQRISIEQAASLVQAFKQVAVDQSSARKRLFDLGETLEGVVASFMPTIRQAQAKIEVIVQAEPGIACDTFPGAVVQISSNMLQNALRHAFDGRTRGRVDLRAWSQAGPDGALIANVEFRDDGNGLPAGRESEIFQPYFTTKASEGGSGIGLSLSRELAQLALGGELTASNAPEGGTVFLLSFPVLKI